MNPSHLNKRSLLNRGDTTKATIEAVNPAPTRSPPARRERMDVDGEPTDAVPAAFPKRVAVRDRPADRAIPTPPVLSDVVKPQRSTANEGPALTVNTNSRAHVNQASTITNTGKSLLRYGLSNPPVRHHALRYSPLTGKPIATRRGDSQYEEYEERPRIRRSAQLRAPGSRVSHRAILPALLQSDVAASSRNALRL